jgi:hypothetical protein
MAEQVKRASVRENRTTSELVREALRRYFGAVWRGTHAAHGVLTCVNERRTNARSL